MSNRLEKALTQHARENGSVRNPQDAAQLTEMLAGLCGPQSQSRQAKFRLGAILLTQQKPVVLIPVCPDYGHEGGRYTFRHLGRGVPLSVKLHLAFLRRAEEILPCRAHFLIADREEEDAVICRAVGVDQREFARRVGDSLCEIADTVVPLGWAASRMSEVILDLASLEAFHADYICNDAALTARIKSDTIDRKEMYWRICRELSVEEMLARTARTMAQYRAVGSFAASRGYLVANHTTTNLSAYADVGAALLHNPVEVY